MSIMLGKKFKMYTNQIIRDMFPMGMYDMHRYRHSQLSHHPHCFCVWKAAHIPLENHQAISA